MCLRNLQTFGAWGPNRCWDIDFPTPPCICSSWPRFGHWYSACGCANTSQVVYKCSYVSQESPKKFGAWGPNRCWDIDFPTPLYICSNWPSFEAPMLHPWVCQHLPSSLKMFLCVSETSKKIGAWDPNRCWDIDFPTPPCICSTWPSIQALTLCM